jgi:hypothetical protein
MMALNEAFALALKIVRMCWIQHLLKDVVRKRIAYENAIDRATDAASRMMKQA